MSLPQSNTRIHPRRNEPKESPAPGAVISDRAFWIYGGLLILLALPLIACSPNLTPAPTVAAGATQTAVAPGAAVTPQLTSPKLGRRTKTSGCVAANGLPDAACTPGAISPNATTSQICALGYSSSVRDVPSSVKDQAYAEYGVTGHAPSQVPKSIT